MSTRASLWGAANLLALLAGRYGLAFVGMLKARSQEFQGTPFPNCWWTGFPETGEYDPDKGNVYVLTDESESPAVKIWLHVNNFLIHGDTYPKIARALTVVLDTAVDVGMLCHPNKLTTPPAQVMKYCGFLMDSQGISCLRIPVSKQERALAIVEHLVAARWLGLSKKCERWFDQKGGERGGAVLYTVVPEKVKKDLEWWQGFLWKTEARFARSSCSATLVPNCGIGSGTSTGGTLGLPD